MAAIAQAGNSANTKLEDIFGAKTNKNQISISNSAITKLFENKTTNTIRKLPGQPSETNKNNMFNTMTINRQRSFVRQYVNISESKALVDQLPAQKINKNSNIQSKSLLQNQIVDRRSNIDQLKSPLQNRSKVNLVFTSKNKIVKNRIEFKSDNTYNFLDKKALVKKNNTINNRVNIVNMFNENSNNKSILDRSNQIQLRNLGEYNKTNILNSPQFNRAAVRNPEVTNFRNNLFKNNSLSESTDNNLNIFA